MFDNKQGTVSALPVAIQPYYTNEVRREATGNLIPKEPEGLQMEYADVTYTVYIGKNTKGYPDKYMIKNLPGVEEQYTKYKDGIEYAFHSSYIAWLESEPELIRARDEQGRYVAANDATPENEAYENYDEWLQWQANEPVLTLKALEDFAEYRNWKMMVGVEFDGVMCSATKYDFYGLSSAEEWVRAGNATLWNFDNGNQLFITPDNIDAFYGTWLPFRLSFFS